MKPALAQHQEPVCPSLDGSLQALLSFGTAALRAGSTASRTREWMELLAQKIGLDGLSVSLSLENITAAVHRSGERATDIRDVGPAGINAWRIAGLERLQELQSPDWRPPKSQPSWLRLSQRGCFTRGCRLPPPSP
jgi:hypothetical protein